MPIVRGLRRTATVALPAATWGFAEATLFFVVPDVLVTWLALSSLRRALAAALAAAFGAVAGGAAMHTLAAHDPVTAYLLLMGIPGITERMIASANGALAEGGGAAMLAGAWSGVPYKIYAVAAGAEGWPLVSFLSVTGVVRLPRFLVAALLAAALGRISGRPRTLLAAFWILFYAAYFALAG